MTGFEFLNVALVAFIGTLAGLGASSVLTLRGR